MADITSHTSVLDTSYPNYVHGYDIRGIEVYLISIFPHLDWLNIFLLWSVLRYYAKINGMSTLVTSIFLYSLVIATTSIHLSIRIVLIFLLGIIEGCL